MKMQLDTLETYIDTLEIEDWKRIEISEIIISEEIKDFCKQNKCGKYGKNLMCPPFVGTVEEFKKKLQGYNTGYLIIIKDAVKDSSSMNDFYKSADLLHVIMLDVEKRAKEIGFDTTLALIGGNCRLCSKCNIEFGISHCKYPEKARTSMEALGIDVINTCKKYNLSIEFKNDEVTWAGLLLI